MQRIHADNWQAGDVEDARRLLSLALPGMPFDAEDNDTAAIRRAHKTIYRYAAAKIIPSFRLGRRVMFRRAPLETWIDEGGSGFAGGWRKEAAS